MATDGDAEDVGQDTPLIYHIFADYGVEARVLRGFGDVVRLGLDPADGAEAVVRGDATEIPLQPGADLAVLHPPCTRWSDMTSIDGDPEDHPNLIPEARQLGEQLADDYVIENKPAAPLEDAVCLDGRMFGLPIKFERAFETSFDVPQPAMQPSLGGVETSPYLYASHSHEWWAAAKGYPIDAATKTTLAKNCVPAAFVNHILRAWLTSRGRGEVRDYSRYQADQMRERKRIEAAADAHCQLEGFADD